MSFWDQQFAGDAFKYGERPNEFLVSQASRLQAHSSVLLPGDGEGRNSVWLAEQGHAVVALDQSQVGLDKARRLALARHVHIDTVQADLSDWAPGESNWDAVVMVYLHLPPALRSRVHLAMWQSLRPGGWFILEAFHPKQLGRSSGGPKQLDMLYTLQDLRSDLARVSVNERHEALAWEGDVQLAEGPGHQGLGHVLRYVAQRRG